MLGRLGGYLRLAAWYLGVTGATPPQPLGPTDFITVAKTESNVNPQSEKEREKRKTANSNESRRDRGETGGEENRERLKPASCR